MLTSACSELAWALTTTPSHVTVKVVLFQIQTSSSSLSLKVKSRELEPLSSAAFASIIRACSTVSVALMKKADLSKFDKRVRVRRFEGANHTESFAFSKGKCIGRSKLVLSTIVVCVRSTPSNIVNLSKKASSAWVDATRTFAK